MYTKFLLFALSVAAFSSCSSSYKSGQTPDDVYYSPAKFVNENQNNLRNEAQKEDRDEREIRMKIRNRRWSDFDEDNNYYNSPYHYCTCNCSNYGYYYNPYYHSWPVYTYSVTPANHSPRMVNLRSYTGYNNKVVSATKSANGINWVSPPASYNNSNRSGSGNLIRQIFTPSPSGNDKSSNNTRTYSPSTSSSGNNNSSSGSNSSSGKTKRPNRGG